MTISKDLLLSILSMDAYNQGYGKGFDHGATQIGAAVNNFWSGWIVSAAWRRAA